MPPGKKATRAAGKTVTAAAARAPTGGAARARRAAKKAVVPAPSGALAHGTADAAVWEQVLRRLDLAAEAPPPTAAGYAEFELDFEQALMRQLGPFIEQLPALELTRDNILRTVGEKARGVYYLILNGQLVYIGKTDAKAGLRARLLRHYKALKRRKGINWSEMKFKAVKVASLAALDTESLLLDLHKMKNSVAGGAKPPEWNNSGFGSNDTGKERDTQKVSVFDQKYPLDLDGEIDLEDAVPAGAVSLEAYLKWLGTQLKFTFRRQDPKSIPVRAVRLSDINVNPAEMTRSTTLRDLLLAIHGVLPAGWVLTVLRGKLVLYFEDGRAYKSPLWRLAAGVPAGTANYELGDVGAGTTDEEIPVEEQTEQDPH